METAENLPVKAIETLILEEKMQETRFPLGQAGVMNKVVVSERAGILLKATTPRLASPSISVS